MLRLRVVGLVVGVATTGACTRMPADRISGVYAHDTRALLRLDRDCDGDGRIDVRTYMRHGRAVRLEADANGDGFVDRWEYYDSTGALVRIGGSTQNDGREDTWLRVEGHRRLVDIASARDGRVDRRETYAGDMLIRAESDSNHDGLPDRWEEFRSGALVRLMLDDDRRHGRPTRRIHYEGGNAARVETDRDGDGVWEGARAR